MYYDTPNMTIYLKKIVDKRLPVIVVTLLLVAASLFFIKPNIVSSDTQFWLSDSRELEKSRSADLIPHFNTKVKVFAEATLFHENYIEGLKKLDTMLRSLHGVTSVESIFSEKHLVNEKAGTGSELLKMVNFPSLGLKEQKQIILDFFPVYENFVSQDFRTVYFYVKSDEVVSIDPKGYPFEIEVIQESFMESLDYVAVYAIIVLMLTLMLGIVFKSILAPVSALFIVAFTLIFTIAAIQILLPGVQIHIAMTMITISISLLDYLYIYYRWHVNKYARTNNLAAINMAISKNVKPAMWTTVTTMLGIGTLIFVDSEIIRLLSLSAVLASVIAYILNFTFLPAFLSYFRTETKEVPFAKFSRFLANREVHYKKSYLSMFIIVTMSIGVIAFYEIFSFPSQLFVNKDNNDVISLEVPYKSIDVASVKALGELEENLREQFDSVLRVTSLYSTIKTMQHLEGTAEEPFSVEMIDRYIFLTEMYGSEERVFGEETFKVTVDLDSGSGDKAGAILWIREYAQSIGMPLYFVDIDSILSITKHDKTVILASSLFFALIMIGVIMGFIIKDVFMVFVAFLTNAIPIIWFTTSMLIMKVPLSLEILIAMTITVGLASDATIHFVYKYYISRHFKHSKKAALESVFFYAGVPVVIGSLYLSITFLTLAFTGITTLELIGQYAGVLILMSLFTDLFILPVLLLVTDHFATDMRARRGKKRQRRIH